MTLRALKIQARRPDITLPPGAAPIIAIAWYPATTTEATVAKHAREFATLHGSIGSLLIRRREQKGVYAIVKFQSEAAAAAAVAQEHAPPVGSHLPHVYLWTAALEAVDFNGEPAMLLPLYDVHSSQLARVVGYLEECLGCRHTCDLLPGIQAIWLACIAVLGEQWSPKIWYMLAGNTVSFEINMLVWIQTATCQVDIGTTCLPLSSMSVTRGAATRGSPLQSRVVNIVLSA